MRRLLGRTVSLVLAALLAPGLMGQAWAAPASPDAPSDEARPGRAERGVFATMCRFSHAAPDDPIVFPGQAGKSHLHAFFGNRTTDAGSTYESLRASATTCRTEEDASGYWVPALFRNGTEIRPLAVKVYYRTGRHEPESVSAFPPGFRVVAGDATATSSQGLRTTFWLCRGLRGPEALAGFGPTETPPTCPAENPLTLHVQFPECWDGVSLDSPDHKSHTAYGRVGVCPPSHPTVLPSLSLIVHYPIVGEPGAITLASGSGYSAHADFFNAWDQAFLARSVTECLNAVVLCGVR
jgi:Domain of unknown function (DUF1996)